MKSNYIHEDLTYLKASSSDMVVQNNYPEQNKVTSYPSSSSDILVFDDFNDFTSEYTVAIFKVKKH